MSEKDVIRMEPIECSIRIGEHVTRFVYRFPPFSVVGRVITDDGNIYAIEWKTEEICQNERTNSQPKKY